MTGKERRYIMLNYIKGIEFWGNIKIFMDKNFSCIFVFKEFNKTFVKID